MTPINNNITFANIQYAARAYEKNSPNSIPSSNASENLLDISKAEQIYDLKKALLLAIDGGNFDKAIFILQRLKMLKT
jgi:hypothetical protein